MFIPLHDANSLKHIKLQYVTLAIIAANVIVWILTTLDAESFGTAAVLGFGFIPAVVHDTAELAPQFVYLPEEFSYVTYSFLHGDFWHLAGNMLFLWVFGDNVEDAFGHVRYALFYVICAAAGAFAHGLLLWESESPLIGASGAVAGVVAAYLMLHPHVKVWVLALARIPIRLPAWIPLAFWVAFQFVMVAILPEDQVSWAAHVGGIVAGALLVLVLRRRGVPLFDRVIVTPDAVETAEAVIRPAPKPDAPAHRWGR